MNPDALRAYFRIGMWITLVALVLVLALPRDTPEFVISVCSLAVGLTLTGLVVALNRLMR
jgi:hypothetical protein